MILAIVCAAGVLAGQGRGGDDPADLDETLEVQPVVPGEIERPVAVGESDATKLLGVLIEHNNNVGINAPEIEWSFEPDVDWIDITTVHKGGLFGSDYRMLFPGDGIDGIKRFFLDTLVAFGKRGLACQPAIVGVGLGGSKDITMVLGKQAACLRTVGDRNPDEKIAELELELKDIGNNIGMGPMGFVGSSMVVDCHIEVGYTHTGGMPMSVHTFCLSSRRATARIHADGTVALRTDPKWFTPYMRRESIEWSTSNSHRSKSV